MDAKIKKLCIITALIFCIGILGTVWMFRKPKTTMVEVVQEGTVIYQFDLATVEDMTLEVEYKDSGKNTITIKDGEIFMSNANCNDHTCVNTGKLISPDIPIVCLPHRLIIRFCNENE